MEKEAIIKRICKFKTYNENVKEDKKANGQLVLQKQWLTEVPFVWLTLCTVLGGVLLSCLGA